MSRKENRRRKLTVRRETLRRLSDTDLRAVAGGRLNTRMAQGGAWCSTVYMTHCDGCTLGQGRDVTDCRP
ncbi:MAG TPA: hypothetical protein VKZ63_12160 [Kofleriaceae bacterium]|nr:hypothetical protein [Kofleriaceae bacterium]